MLCVKPGKQERGMECGERGEQGECYIPGMSSKIIGKCREKFPGMLWKILGIVLKHCGKCRWTFRGIPGNVAKYSRECPRKIERIFENNLGHVVKHSVESMKDFGWMHIIMLDTCDHELYLFVK